MKPRILMQRNRTRPRSRLPEETTIERIDADPRVLADPLVPERSGPSRIASGADVPEAARTRLVDRQESGPI